MIQGLPGAADKRSMINFDAPLAGLASAETSLNRTAANIARAGFDGPGDSVDLSAEFVALIEARLLFAANIKVAKTEDQVTNNLVNLLG